MRPGLDERVHELLGQRGALTGRAVAELLGVLRIDALDALGRLADEDMVDRVNVDGGAKWVRR